MVTEGGDGRPTVPAPAPEGARSRRAMVNGVPIHYVIAGSGDPVLLLHGWPETWYAWRNVIPVLADRFTVVAPDMRGYGDSGRPADGYDKVTVATDLHELMRSLGFGRIHLVVQDMGGPVGFAYAASFPADVRDFVFIESAVPGFGLEAAMDVAHGGSWHMGFNMAEGISELLVAGRERPFIEYFYRRGTLRPDALTQADIDEYARTYAAGGLLASFGYYRTLLDDAKVNRERLAVKKLTLPVLSLAAEAGFGDFSHASIAQVAEHVERQTIAGAKHFLVQDQPQAAAAAILDFLTRTR
ncbi:alpha/beta fold hydrolase [Nocardia sp. alder85J]|uniref:alpha/beta fold hydrolase n=1 Tax=Nocardia sp. alder85J TaxID=2862949 RepID=UPI001CD73B98|nr:alpha/beta fold hydrolase [Nocardia sp. alder85J]MCX4091923.1 alpha/beta fold hydrolase [Nocardia sp. alder85J]